jgi:hypothetical protein
LEWQQQKVKEIFEFFHNFIIFSVFVLELKNFLKMKKIICGGDGKFMLKFWLC